MTDEEKIKARIIKIVRDTALLNVLSDILEIHSTSLIGVMNQREKMLFNQAMKSWDLFTKSVKRGVDDVYTNAVDEDAGKFLDIIDHIFDNELDNLEGVLQYLKEKTVYLTHEEDEEEKPT